MLPLFVDKAVKFVSTLLQYIKELLAQAAFANRKAFIIATWHCISSCNTDLKLRY